MEQEQLDHVLKKLPIIPQYKDRVEKIKQGVSLILDAFDLDKEGQHLEDTPERVASAYLNEILGGYFLDAKQVLCTTFDEQEYDQLIFVDGIEVYSTCAHHMTSFVGEAKIGYLPKERVVGLSKLSRITNVFARRLQVQEKLTKEIANAIQEHLQPAGCGVYIQAKHFCACIRGVKNQNMYMKTTALRGEFKSNQSLKDEFLKLCLQKN